jgi:hypothetical protein
MRSGKRCAFGVVTSLVWLLAGCSSEDTPVFNYGKAEMESAVVGTWTGSWMQGDSPPSSLTLVIDTQNDPSARRTACGSQTFSASPPPGLRLSCSEMSTLAVTGLLSVDDPTVALDDLSGSYAIHSANFIPGDLYLTSADGTTQLTANQAADFSWESCSVSLDGVTIACTLDSRE